MIDLPPDFKGNKIVTGKVECKAFYHPKGFIPDWKFMEDYINTLPFSDRI